MRCHLCFREISGEKCSYCGHDNQQEQRGARFLLPETYLQNGRYQIGTVVGAGGFGITYVAWDNVLEKRVAIKEYLPGEFSTRFPGDTNVTVYGGEKEEQYINGLSKFYEESKRLAMFREIPGIVHVYNCFKENKTGYIVMDFLEGETLSERLKRVGKIEPSEAIAIITPILQALSAVHKSGILHRDIAPNNIFISNSGEVTLIDFGAARSATGTYSKSLTVLYKEGYTPEEQYRSRGEQGSWTDIYACAATMYKMITGVTPEGAMERRRKDTLKAPSKYISKISSNIDNAIMNALNLDISKRTQSADDFLNELMSDGMVVKRFERVEEKKTGKIPNFVWIAVGTISIIASVYIVLLLSGIISFDVYTLTNMFVDDGKARVLNIVNMNYEEAEKKLEKYELKLNTESVMYSNDVKPGRIISQSIKKGQLVDKGTVISAIVSREANPVEIPDLVGIEKNDAIKILEDLNIQCEVEEMESTDAPGLVVEQDVTARNAILEGSTVAIGISKGTDFSNMPPYSMEDCVGKEYQDAKEKLIDNGVYSRIKTYEYSDTIPKGVIISQSISVDSKLNPSKEVTIQEFTISLGIEQIKVPAVVGLSKEEAIKELKSLQFNPIVNTVVDREKKTTEGTVIAQGIKENTEVDKYTDVSIDVVIWGIEVPNIKGMTLAQAEKTIKESGLGFSSTEVLGGNGTVVSQSVGAGEIVDEGTKIVANMGVTNAEFTQKLVAAINQRRASQGLDAVTLDSQLSASAQQLANTGKTSGSMAQDELRNFYNSIGLQLPRGAATFWATRDNVTTVESLIDRLPWTSKGTAYLSSNPFRHVGIGYYGTRICMLIADN